MGSVVALSATLLTAPVAPTAATHDVTDPAEAARVDSVNVDGLTFGSCNPDSPRERHFKCATLDMPLDYDNPDAGTYTVNVVRSPAHKPEERVGTLFVNPGGPSASAAGLAAYSLWLLPESITDKFDIVGVEPRGAGINDPIQCADSYDEHVEIAGLVTGMFPPANDKEKVEYYQNARKYGKACLDYQESNKHMSTAQVVRDMDVVRRALGVDKMRYLGFSYGTAIGQAYANMFPDRVGAIVNDGVVNGPDWFGTDGNGMILHDARLGTARGAEKALNKALELCDQAGPDLCKAAANDKDPRSAVKKWEDAAAILAEGPVTYYYDYPQENPDGTITIIRMKATISMELMAAHFLGSLYEKNNTAEKAGLDLWRLWNELNLRETPNSPEAVAAGTELHKALTRSANSANPLTDRSTLMQGIMGRDATNTASRGYGTEMDVVLNVTCNDSLHPMQLPDHMRQADAMIHDSIVFGRTWGWQTVACSSEAWQAHDPSAYRGTFDKVTSGPVMFIGNLWDPATNSDQAQKAADRRPGSKLIMSDSWGHTALGTSDCVTDAVATFLTTGEAADRLECSGNYQPYAKGSAASDDMQHTNQVDDSGIGATSPAVPVGSTAVYDILKAHS